MGILVRKDTRLLALVKCHKRLSFRARFAVGVLKPLRLHNQPWRRVGSYVGCGVALAIALMVCVPSVIKHVSQASHISCASSSSWTEFEHSL